MQKTSTSWTNPQNTHAHTSVIYQLPQFAMCCEPHPSTSDIITVYLILDNLPCTPSRNLTSCNPLAPTSPSKPFKVKYRIYFSIYVFLNQLTGIKLC